MQFWSFQSGPAAGAGSGGLFGPYAINALGWMYLGSAFLVTTPPGANYFNPRVHPFGPPKQQYADVTANAGPYMDGIPLGPGAWFKSGTIISTWWFSIPNNGVGGYVNWWFLAIDDPCFDLGQAVFTLSSGSTWFNITDV